MASKEKTSSERLRRVLERLEDSTKNRVREASPVISGVHDTLTKFQEADKLAELELNSLPSKVSYELRPAWLPEKGEKEKFIKTNLEALAELVNNPIALFSFLAQLYKKKPRAIDELLEIVSYRSEDKKEKLKSFLTNPRNIKSADFFKSLQIVNNFYQKFKNEVEKAQGKTRGRSQKLACWYYVYRGQEIVKDVWQKRKSDDVEVKLVEALSKYKNNKNEDNKKKLETVLGKYLKERKVGGEAIMVVLPSDLAEDVDKLYSLLSEVLTKEELGRIKKETDEVKNLYQQYDEELPDFFDYKFLEEASEANGRNLADIFPSHYEFLKFVRVLNMAVDLHLKMTLLADELFTDEKVREAKGLVVKLVKDIYPGLDMVDQALESYLYKLFREGKIDAGQFSRLLFQESWQKVSFLEKEKLLNEKIVNWLAKVFEFRRSLEEKQQKINEKIDDYQEEVRKDYFSSPDKGSPSADSLKDLILGADKNFDRFFPGYNLQETQGKLLKMMFGDEAEKKKKLLETEDKNLSADELEEKQQAQADIEARIYEILMTEIISLGQEFGAYSVQEPTVKILALLGLLPREAKSRFFAMVLASRFELSTFEITEQKINVDPKTLNDLRKMEFEIGGKKLKIEDALDIWEEPADKYFKNGDRSQGLKNPTEWESWIVVHNLARGAADQERIETRVAEMLVKAKLNKDFDNLSKKERSLVKVIVEAARSLSNITFRSAIQNTGASNKEEGLFKGLTCCSAFFYYVSRYGWPALKDFNRSTMADVLSRSLKGNINLFKDIRDQVGLTPHQKDIFDIAIRKIFFLPTNFAIRRVGEVHLLANNDDLWGKLVGDRHVQLLIKLIENNNNLRTRLANKFNLSSSLSGEGIVREMMRNWSYRYLSQENGLLIKQSDYIDFFKYARAFDAVKGELFAFSYQPTKKNLIKIYQILANTSAGPEFVKAVMRPLVEEYIRYYKPRSVFSLSRSSSVFGYRVKKPGDIGGEAGGVMTSYDLIRGKWIVKDVPLLKLWYEKLWKKKAVGQYQEETDEGQRLDEKAIRSIDYLRGLWSMITGQASVAQLLDMEGGAVSKKELVDDLVEFRKMHMIDSPMFYSIIRKEFGLWFYLQYRFHLGWLTSGFLFGLAGYGIKSSFSSAFKEGFKTSK